MEKHSMADLGKVDRNVSRQFWEKQALKAGDPRSVTLDQDSDKSVQRELQIYQRWLFRRMELQNLSFDHVVDLGCGNGDWTYELALRCQQICAVDLSQGFLDFVKGRLEGSSREFHASYHKCDAASFEFPPDTDLIVMGAVTQYINDDEMLPLLKRAYVSLKSGGTLYFRTTIAKGGDRREMKNSEFQGIYRSRTWIVDSLQNAGFSILHSERATEFLAKEWARGWAKNPAVWALAGLPISCIGTAFLKVYRSGRPTDVLMCLAQKN